MAEPTVGQLLLLAAAIVVFAAGGIVSLARLRGDRAGLRLAAKICFYVGIALSVGVLIWHSAYRGSWMPIEDNFDALIWLAVLLALFVQYVQKSKPLGGLEWFIMPMVILLLIGAGVFGRTQPHDYLPGTWEWTHRITSYGGTVAFVIAGVTGVMYLIKLRQLRSKIATPNLGSLERLENITYTNVTWGFALMSVGVITGVVQIIRTQGHNTLGDNWLASPKIWLSMAVWFVYALVLHAPINPSFRGRKAAVASVLGLVLTIGTLVAVQYMPDPTAVHPNHGAR